MIVDKPKLSIDEQVVHLKNKGVKFLIMGEKEAKTYLEENNNYFKLTAYRKNYQQHTDGENANKYIRLEFAYLVDMAVIDMELRYQLVHMALDIEHHTKLQLLHKVENSSEDGYQIVKDYFDFLTNKQEVILENELLRNKNNIYCGGIIKRYDGNYPIWAFVEIIPFGRLIDFYGFCANRFEDKKMQDSYFRLRTCKQIRNAAAHSNCILNDLRSGTTKYSTNLAVTQELARISGISKKFRKDKMSNARIQQIVTLLYTHKIMVKSTGIVKKEKAKLKKLIERMEKNSDYYVDNAIVKSSYDFLKLVVDNWFLIE